MAQPGKRIGIAVVLEEIRKIFQDLHEQGTQQGSLKNPVGIIQKRLGVSRKTSLKYLNALEREGAIRLKQEGKQYKITRLKLCENSVNKIPTEVKIGRPAVGIGAIMKEIRRTAGVEVGGGDKGWRKTIINPIPAILSQCEKDGIRIAQKALRGYLRVLEDLGFIFLEMQGRKIIGLRIEKNGLPNPLEKSPNSRWVYREKPVWMPRREYKN